MATVLVWVRLAAFNDRVSTAPSASTSLWGPMTSGSERVNVLILGYGGPEHEGPFLTDSINVLSIDPASDKSVIIPIPRDIWIEGHPDVPGNGKINQAFSLGHGDGGIVTGAETAARVVTTVTGLPIHHWLTIDFDGLVAAVDAVGGITVENTTSFSYGSPQDVSSGSAWDGTFAAGPIDLDGPAALMYARTRFTSDAAESTDFARSIRQQRVLKALVDEVAGSGIGSLPRALRVMGAVDDHLRTDLSVIDLGLLADRLTADGRIELSEGLVLEATTTTDGQYVLVPIGRTGPTDYEPIHRYLAGALAEQELTPNATPGDEP
ncbi:MAG: LCP family protein [Chloroflexi bacterium]|nr:LCP family protein [Chloroflexota bacterium]